MTYRNWLRLVWRPATDGIGLPQLTPHDCRHSYITWLMAAGADQIKVQRVVGHNGTDDEALHAPASGRLRRTGSAA